MGVRVEGATRFDKRGAVRDDLPLVDGEHRFDTSPYMWRLNTRTGAVVERQLDDTYVEFPRVNDDFICSGARYSYMAAIQPGQPTSMPENKMSIAPSISVLKIKTLR